MPVVLTAARQGTGIDRLLQEIDAIVDRREDASGYVVLSHEKARRIRATPCT